MAAAISLIGVSFTAAVRAMTAPRRYVVSKQSTNSEPLR
jgi:hypothetical protein